MIKPDSALLRNNDDFYIPSWSEQPQAEVGLFFRINKIGKSVSMKFADRYLSEAGLSIMFYMSDAKNIVAKHAFDKSLAVSKSLSIDEFYNSAKDISLVKNGDAIELPSITSEGVNEHFIEATKMVTCKIGDVLFIPLRELGEVKEDDRFAFNLGGLLSMKFVVK